MNRWLLITVLPIAAVSAVAVSLHAQQGASPTTGPANAAPGGPGAGPGGHRPPPPREGRGGPRDDRGPGGPGGAGGPGGRHEGPPHGGPGGPGGPGGHDGPGGPGGGPQGPGAHGRRPPTMDTMRGYIELVSRYTELSSDPTKASISAVVTAGDLLRTRGNDSAIAYFEKLLPEVQTNESVNRAVRLQLVELYKASGQTDKALEQLRILIIRPGETALQMETQTTQP